MSILPSHSILGGGLGRVVAVEGIVEIADRNVPVLVAKRVVNE